ncbi:hypothetical protein CAEBREN_02398 [Caenorhabditis brenneri]|uniref:Uncharacterized protein n=1 Tax=Caenorhabditis brenneri TaxID=135651 RepID=G0P024_CAEBE|nr:hypothetical protein CAEBREN_02398 [Caenorhabditis brenneri]
MNAQSDAAQEVQSFGGRRNAQRGDIVGGRMPSTIMRKHLPTSQNSPFRIPTSNNFEIEASTEFRNLFDAAVLVDTSDETDPEERRTLYELISEGSSPKGSSKALELLNARDDPE